MSLQFRAMHRRNTLSINQAWPKYMGSPVKVMEGTHGKCHVLIELVPFQKMGINLRDVLSMTGQGIVMLRRTNGIA